LSKPDIAAHDGYQILHSRALPEIVDGPGGYIVRNPTAVRSVRALRIGTQAPQTDFIDTGNVVRRRFDAIHHLTEEIAPREIGLALTAADVVSISKSGRKVAVIGIENGYPIGTDVSRAVGDELDGLRNRVRFLFQKRNLLSSLTALSSQAGQVSGRYSIDGSFLCSLAQSRLTGYFG